MKRITEKIEGRREKAELEVDGRTVKLSNLDRVLYPETGFTKGDLIDYYAAVAPVLLPHLRDRPLTMRRFPEGVDEDGFWEKHCPEHRPEWVKTFTVESESSRGPVEFCLVNDLPTLIWVANLACVELHISLARARSRSTPTVMVFDLDPGKPADVLDCAEIALLIRDTLAGQDLDCLAKVSGSKGLQVYVPLNTRTGYDSTGEFAHALARTFESEMPDQVVSKMRKNLRHGKVLVDWSQNSRHKTTVAVYSMRARPEPSVSVPIGWDELESALDAGDDRMLRFSPEQTLARVDESGDLFAPVLDQRQNLPK
ncbi:MAG: non-homologous end-joining DNA ligase [Solirubrobacterales bacterium]|nr:non-homologous end-joining DNA ligase [Solirubrobacterales bacterium]